MYTPTQALGTADAYVRSGRSASDILIALALSALAHGAVAAWLRAAPVEPPKPFAFEHIEVSLAASPAPRAEPREALADAPPAPVHAKQPAADTIRQPDPSPQANKSASDRDEPLVEARFNVATLHNPKPPYPLASRRRGEEGRVVLTVLVRADGACGETRLKQSSGYSLLDESAMKTVRAWRFVPARRGDTPVDSWVDVPIAFRLEDAG